MSILVKKFLLILFISLPLTAVSQEVQKNPVVGEIPVESQSKSTAGKSKSKPQIKLETTPDPSSIGDEPTLGTPQPGAPTRNENPVHSPSTPTEETTSPVDTNVPNSETKKEPKWYESQGDDRANRSSKKWGFTGNYSLLEMWVLTKYGFTAQYIKDPSWTYELEYMRGSIGFGYFGIDIGRIKEERISAIARSFGKRDSFNFIYGIFYNQMEVKLGSDLLEAANLVSRDEIDRAQISLGGLTWGMGNRWQTRQGYTVGVDWLSIHLPFSVIQQHAPFLKRSTDEDKRDDFSDSLKWLKRFPAIGFLKFQIGMTF